MIEFSLILFPFFFFFFKENTCLYRKLSSGKRDNTKKDQLFSGRGISFLSVLVSIDKFPQQILHICSVANIVHRYTLKVFGSQMYKFVENNVFNHLKELFINN